MICQSLQILLAVLLLPFAPRPYAPPANTVDVAVFAFQDLDADGAYGLTTHGMEPALSGVAVQLYADHAPFNSRGPEDLPIEVRDTNAEGFAVFHQLAAGRYILFSSLTTGFLPTTPREQYITAQGAGGATVLEYLFGQLQREAFIVSFIFPMTHTGPSSENRATGSTLRPQPIKGASVAELNDSIALKRETRFNPRRNPTLQRGDILEP